LIAARERGVGFPNGFRRQPGRDDLHVGGASDERGCIKFRVGTGIIIFGHGSRIESANEAVRQVAAEVASAGGYAAVESAFLELGEPDLEEAVDRLARRGVARILVIPYFLTAGTHLERDLPVLVASARKSHPDIEIRTAPPLDGHPALVRILLDRAREAG